MTLAPLVLAVNKVILEPLDLGASKVIRAQLGLKELLGPLDLTAFRVILEPEV